MTLVESASVLVAALLLEAGLASLTTVIGAFAVVQVLSGIGWLLVVPAERREEDGRGNEGR